MSIIRFIGRCLLVYLDCVLGDLSWYRTKRGGHWHRELEEDCSGWCNSYAFWIREQVMDRVVPRRRVWRLGTNHVMTIIRFIGRQISSNPRLLCGVFIMAGLLLFILITLALPIDPWGSF